MKTTITFLIIALLCVSTSAQQPSSNQPGASYLAFEGVAITLFELPEEAQRVRSFLGRVKLLAAEAAEVSF